MNHKLIITLSLLLALAGTAIASDASANHPKDDISFTISAWVNMDDATNFWILSKGTRDYPEYAFGVNANDILSLTIHDGSMRATSTIYSATSSYIQALSSSALTNDQNTWIYLTAAYNGSATSTGMRLYRNAELVSATINASSTYVRMHNHGERSVVGGLYIDGSVFANGRLDDLRAYPYARTIEEIRSDYNAGLGAKFGGSPNKDINRGLVGYWQFNEGAGQIAKDSNGSANHGLLGADSAIATNDPSWISATGTIAEKAGLDGTLKFDGTDDVVTIPNADSIDFDVGLKEGVTFSAWINAETDGEGAVGQFLNKGATTFIRVDTRSGNNIDIESSLDLATSDATLNISAPVTINTWNHVVMTYGIGAGDEITVYINGTSRGSSTNGSGKPAADASNLLIGGVSSANFDGQIDEVRIYNRALSAEEIRYLYNQGEPVGYWKLDEGSGGTAYDSSGNNNNGTLQNMATSTAWTTGKYGTALDFDGTNDFVLAPDSPSLSITSDLTISGWIKPDVNTASTLFDITGKWDGASESYLLAQFGDEIRTYIDASANFKTTDSADLEINTWYHITASYNSSARTVDIYINGILQPGTITGTIPASIGDDTGRFHVGAEDGSANFFNGLIDDVRVYNYVRSPQEIQQDYNAGLGAQFR